MCQIVGPPFRRSCHVFSSSSLLLSSLEMSDAKSVSLKYEPSSEPLHNNARIQGLLESKDTHRPEEFPMLLGIGLP